jgi:hypothetical protein
VFAFPIKHPRYRRVIGVIDVNSDRTVADLGWPGSGARLTEVGREAAGAIYHIIERNLP